MTMRCSDGLRTSEEQDAIYEQGRTTTGERVTYARGLASLHCYGLAADSCFESRDPYLEKMRRGIWFWSEFGRMCKQQGLVSGSDFPHPDRPHAEITYGLKLIDLQELYAEGGLAGVWKQLDKIRGSKL